MWNVSQGLMQFCVLLKNNLEYVTQISRGVLCCREQQVSSDCSAVTCSLRRVHTTPNTMTNLSVSSVAVPTECLVCSELALLIHFFPCQHSIVCEGKFFCFFCTFFFPPFPFRHAASLSRLSYIKVCRAVCDLKQPQHDFSNTVFR